MDVFHFCVFGFFSFAFGACVASFLNVCIWRLPRNESVVKPASHCPKCNAAIKWYQNVPVISYVALGGRCADCREPISVRYTVVELLGGLLFLMAYLQWAVPAAFADAPVAAMRPLLDFASVPVYWLVFSGLILGSFIDLEHFYLPSVSGDGDVAQFATPCFGDGNSDGIICQSGIFSLCRRDAGLEVIKIAEKEIVGFFQLLITHCRPGDDISGEFPAVDDLRESVFTGEVSC